jgi:putative DNA methylase
LRTERVYGIKGADNYLASSILLVCRARPSDAPLATRREFVSLLKKELPEALLRLQHSNIAPVDLAQAAIGPGMAIYSRYSKVLEADGNRMNVRMALQLINQELDAYLDKQENELDQESRFCLRWFEQYGHQAGPFGEADVLARAKNTSAQTLDSLGLIQSRAGKVRLIRRSELPRDLDLSKIVKLSIWLCTQELIRKLEEGGEAEVAKLILKIGGGQSESAKDLAYRIFSICEKKGWSGEAMAYNNLVTSWNAIQEKAGLRSVPVGQMRL